MLVYYVFVLTLIVFSISKSDGSLKNFRESTDIVCYLFNEVKESIYI
jgi:hypothetical protein